jgi:hypothetical protein
MKLPKEDLRGDAPPSNAITPFATKQLLARARGRNTLVRSVLLPFVWHAKPIKVLLDRPMKARAPRDYNSFSTK